MDPLKIEIKFASASFVKIWLYIVATFMIGYSVGRWGDEAFYTGTAMLENLMYDRTLIVHPRPDGSPA